MDISPFASPFATPFGAGPEPGEPARTVGFDERSASSADSSTGDPWPPRTGSCALVERAGSIGALTSALALQQQQQQQPKGPLLSIQTRARSLRVPRAKRVGAIQEEAPALFAGGAHPPLGTDGLLGSTLPAGAPGGPLLSLARAKSGNIDMPNRHLSKAQTAPNGLPDSLVAAALAAGTGRSSTGPHGASRFSPPAAAAAAAMPGTLPGQHGPQQGGAMPQLRQQPQEQAALPTQRSGSGGGGSGSGGSGPGDSSTGSTATSAARPPMTPITPAALAAKRAGQKGMQRSQSIGYGHLFAAMAETTQAHAQVAGMQEALRRKDEELDALRRDLARVSTERDVLREAAAPPAAPAVAAAAPHGGLTRAAPTGGPQPLRLQAGRARSGLGLGCRGSAAAPCVGQDGMQAPTLAPVVAGQPHPAAQQSPPAMVSAFADALPFSFG